MKILVTGAKGFVGKNLCWALKNIRDGKDRRFSDLKIDDIFEYDIDSTLEQLDAWCSECDFVFNLAGVNRPKETSEFMEGNFGFASVLLDTLKKHGNRCPVMLSSSQQASLAGRFGNSEYGRSKLAGEELFLQYERDFLQADNDSSSVIRHSSLTSRVLIYRFPNLFGKWCRPNYNSAVATFCHNIANDLPIKVNDPTVELELLYIDDLVDEMIAALQGKEHRCEFNGLEVLPAPIDDADGTDDADGANGADNLRDQDESARSAGTKYRYCYCPVTHHVTLGDIVDLLLQFSKNTPSVSSADSEPSVGFPAPLIPEIPEGSFAKKLYTTYLSYLPKEKVSFPLKMNVDDRGSFTELIHTLNCGQVSINISKPGITKGQHWHNTKWEFFIVVAGHGLIQQRNLNDPEARVLEWEVSGDHIEAVHMLPGYTHNIINLSETENLVTVMYANELFDPNHPDTFFEPV